MDSKFKYMDVPMSNLHGDDALCTVMPDMVICQYVRRRHVFMYGIAVVSRKWVLSDFVWSGTVAGFVSVGFSPVLEY